MSTYRRDMARVGEAVLTMAKQGHQFTANASQPQHRETALPLPSIDFGSQAPSNPVAPVQNTRRAVSGDDKALPLPSLDFTANHHELEAVNGAGSLQGGRATREEPKPAPNYSGAAGAPMGTGSTVKDNGVLGMPVCFNERQDETYGGQDTANGLPLPVMNFAAKPNQQQNTRPKQPNAQEALGLPVMSF